MPRIDDAGSVEEMAERDALRAAAERKAIAEASAEGQEALLVREWNALGLDPPRWGPEGKPISVSMAKMLGFEIGNVNGKNTLILPPRRDYQVEEGH